ncbi:phosphatidylinositol-specific phospholipase C, X domain containing protein [Nitzschia inconspicua]|uniref:Phosphatidylinositol-specific phospholipase C, X domain containing protein n=1 Tax=Nitzschia inconspicua TaxID=303405 RepID=A0A9K3Q688_9STRA|nr:phosphatidylinositol-specific phospholipase C, X domain containing protein [Nitzschia inconspicua]
MRRLIRRKGGAGGYLRIQNRSNKRVEFKVVEKDNVDDMGMDQIQGVMEPGSHLPAEGTQPFEDEDGNADPDMVYCYIEGNVRNRLQKNGFMLLNAIVEGASPSCLKLIVNHNSWRMEDTSPDQNSPVILVADVSEEDGMWKIELRIYNHYNTKRWMAQLESSIKDLPLTQVGIPGTHDSGTYCFDREKGASPDSDLTTMIQSKLPGRLLGAVSNVILDQVFGRLCQCQDKSIKQQLEMGIRYLDLRVAFHAESGQYYTCHGVYCADMVDVMKQITDFLNANPKELVILDFNHMYQMDGHHKKFLKMVFDALGDKAANQNIKGGLSVDSKVQRFWNHGFQAIVFYQFYDQVKDDFGGKVWPMWRIVSPWPESASTDDLYTKLGGNVQNRLSQHMDKLFVVQGILTPDVELIKRGLSDGDGLSIKGYARRANPRVIDWCEDDWMKLGKRCLNIVIVDFYDGCSMVPALLNYNRKD